MKEYPSNDFTSPPAPIEEAPKEPQDATPQTGGIMIKKRNPFRKFVDNFVQDDARSIFGHVMEEIIGPTLRKMLFESIMNASERAIFKNGTGGPIQNTLYNGIYNGMSRISYGTPSYYNNSYYRNYQQPQQQVPNDRPSYKSSFDYRDISFDSREVAQQILFDMDEIFSAYPGTMVSIADYIEIIKKHCNPADRDAIPNAWSNNSYGWNDIHSARVDYDTSIGRYVIRLPKPMPI